MVSHYFALFTLLFFVISLDWTKSVVFGEDQEIPSPIAQSPSDEPTSQPIDPQKKSKTSPPTKKDLKAQQDLEALRSNPKEFRTLVLGVQIFLGRFGYGVGPYTGTLDDQTKEALRKFQEYAHLPTTGDIDIHTLKHLTDDNKALNQVIPLLPNAQVHQSSNRKTVHTKGTWARNDQSEPMGLFQTSLVTCDKDHGQCVESTAFLQTETGNAPTLSVDHLWYEVKSWTEKEIVTNPLDVDSCSVAILRVNLEQQSASRFLSVQYNDGLCVQNTPGDFFYRLVNGRQISWKGKQQKAQQIQKILRVTHPVE